MRLGRLTEALPDFKEAAELAHSIGSRDEELYRAFHALTKTRLGDLSELALRREEIGATVNAGAGVGFSVYGYTMLFYDAACATRRWRNWHSRTNKASRPSAGDSPIGNSGAR